MACSERGAPADPLVVQAVAKCLASGGVVLLPTDTVLGLAALPAHAEAVAQVFKLKSRQAEKHLPIMVASLAQIEKIGGMITKSASALAGSPYCPGALTLIVGLDSAKAPSWLAGREEIAFRIPDDACLLALLETVGPLFVTSANRSGEDTPASTEEAVAQLAGRPDHVVAGCARGAFASTIVNCRASPPVIERQGAIPAERLAEYIKP